MDGKLSKFVIIDAEQKFSTGSECSVAGVVESANFVQGDDQGFVIMRKFVFRRVSAIDKANPARDSTMGAIELQTVVGNTEENTLDDIMGKVYIEQEKSVKKIVAIKQGNTIAVGQCDRELLTHVSRGSTIMKDHAIIGKVRLYVRERNFMISNGLIDDMEDIFAADDGVSNINSTEAPGNAGLPASGSGNISTTSRNEDSEMKTGDFPDSIEPQQTLSCSLGTEGHLMYLWKDVNLENVTQCPGGQPVNSRKRAASSDVLAAPTKIAKRTKENAPHTD